jgi:pyrroline-5-carboxylate reductase
MLEERLGFIGAGQMAEALMRGLVRSGTAVADRIMASDVRDERLEYIRNEVGVETTTDNLAVVAYSHILVLAVKPNVVTSVVQEIKGRLSDKHLVISIAAGVPLAKLERDLPPSARVVRVMPNTPCLVGETAAGYALGRNATEEDAKKVEQILSAVGRSFRLEEKLLDAVTGLSGSGPAYVYILIEALADGGVRAGLPRNVALELAAQTVLGAAKMVLETGLHPGELKDRVASPGGTTIAGIHELERAGFRAALINAVQAATTRARELGQ